MTFFNKKILIILALILGAVFYAVYKKNDDSCICNKAGLDKKVEYVNVPYSLPKLPKNSVRALSRFEKPDLKKAFSYINKDAPKGGTLRLGTVGTFDTLNWFSIKGIAAQGLLLCYDMLMKRSDAQNFSLYHHVAQGVAVSKDSSTVTFHLDPQAKFHDGSPVTADDVEFTVEILRQKGLPRYKRLYGRIDKIEKIYSFIEKTQKIDPQTIIFHLKADDKGDYDPELPIILGLIKILSKKQLEAMDFENSGLTHIMGTGPYKIGKVQQGRQITFDRNQHYWAQNHPVTKGMYNFDRIKIYYFNNAQAEFQGFLSGDFDIIFEMDPNRWHTNYIGKNIENGNIVRVEREHQRPVSVRTVIFNMQKDKFKNRHLREAIELCIDRETVNRLSFHSALKVPHSLFQNTDYAHQGAATGLELALLKKHAGSMDKKVFDKMVSRAFTPSTTEGNGNQRNNITKALSILKAAGYTFDAAKNVLTDPFGTPVEIELMVKDPRLKPISLSFQRSLRNLGINLVIRQIDNVQYENKVLDRSFDMIFHTWSNGKSPGIEQGYYFGRRHATMEGSSNYIGVEDVIAENLSKELIKATTQAELVAATRALDRYVAYQHYQLMLFYDNKDRFAYWKDRIGMPDIHPKAGFNVMAHGWSKQS